MQRQEPVAEVAHRPAREIITLQGLHLLQPRSNNSRRATGPVSLGVEAAEAVGATMQMLSATTFWARRSVKAHLAKSNWERMC